MPALKDLIPVDFFAPPPVVANPAHGRIGIYTGPLAHLRGRVLVTWERGCPLFGENLDAARRLKNAGHGNYFGNEAGGWLFLPVAVKAVDEAFAPTLVRSEAFLALLNAPPPAPKPAAAPAAPARVLHGTIRLVAGQYLVAFGNGYNVPRDRFAEYLDAARSIRNACHGSKGWQSASKCWSFSRQAAGRIVEAFPAAHFDYPAELTADAAKFPAPAKVDRAAADAQARDTGGPDALAVRLLAVAEQVLATC